LFKLAIFPFHFWIADVYEGAPTIITAFFAIVPKIALIGLFIRICIEVMISAHYFLDFIYICGLLSIFYEVFFLYIKLKLNVYWRIVQLVTWDL